MQIKRLFWVVIAATALLLLAPTSAFADDAVSQQDDVMDAAQNSVIVEEPDTASLSDDAFVGAAAVSETALEESTISPDSDAQEEGEGAVDALDAEQAGEAELDLSVDDSVLSITF